MPSVAATLTASPVSTLFRPPRLGLCVVACSQSSGGGFVEDLITDDASPRRRAPRHGYCPAAVTACRSTLVVRHARYGCALDMPQLLGLSKATGLGHAARPRPRVPLWPWAAVWPM
jgi:hypothetical protein